MGTAVDVCPIIQQMLDDVEPAPGTCLMEGAVTSVITMIHFTYSVFQTVQHHFLKKRR